MQREGNLAAMGTLRGATENPQGVLRSWKGRGKRAVGYRCLYVPEELITAAGMLPFPLFGTPEPIGVADSYFQPCTCEFVRNVFDRTLRGDFGDLDGLALCNTCDIVRRLYDMWGTYVEGVPVYILNNPQKLLDESSRDYFLEELRRATSWIETISGTKVTADGLRRAIRAHNETRRLLRRLYALREQEAPLVTAEEALCACMAASIMPREEGSAALRALIDEAQGRRSPYANDGPRILVTGSVVDNPALLTMIEQEGGVVVVEDLCTTTRYFWHDADEDGDPMEALYGLLNRRALCACMDPAEARIAHVLELVERYEVAGVIDFTLKYCHPFLYEAPILKRRLEQKGIATSILEVGHDMSGHGQLRTRIQAFIEMLAL